MEPSNREFCVNSRVMLDGHTVKLAHSEVSHHNVSVDSLFYLPGAHYVTVQHDDKERTDKEYRREQKAREKLAKSKQQQQGEGQHAAEEKVVANGDDVSPAVVIERLNGLLADAEAKNELLQAELDEEREKFRQEARRWTDLFNHKPHLFGEKAKIESFIDRLETREDGQNEARQQSQKQQPPPPQQQQWDRMQDNERKERVDNDQSKQFVQSTSKEIDKTSIFLFALIFASLLFVNWRRN